MRDLNEPTAVVLVARRMIATTDRRRPARPERIHPALTDLLRDAANIEVAAAPPAPRELLVEAEDVREYGDGLRAASGILFGVALSAILWAVMGSAIYRLVV